MDIGDRRRFLKVAGVSVGAAWVAPQIISVSAAGAATLPPAPNFITCAGAHDTNGSDLTITIGAGVGELNVLAGDFLLALTVNHIDDGHTESYLTPTGWTAHGTQDARDTGGQNPGVRTQLFSHIVGGGDTSYTFQLNALPPASTAVAVLIVAYRGAVSLDPASPATSFTQTGATSITVGGLSPSSPNVTTVAMIGAENPENPWTPDTGYTEVCDYIPNTSVPEIYVADANLNTTSIPPATFTASASGHPEAAWLIGLSPV